MEVREGYKKTEVGVIPGDWDHMNFGDLVIDFRGGASLAPKDFVSYGMHVLPKSGVTRGGLLSIDPKDQQYCNWDFANKNKSSWVDKSYTIIVLRDLVPSGPNIGLMVSIPNNIQYVLAQGVYGFRVIDDKVISDYLIHLSNSNEYRKLMKSILVGSTQVHIRNTTIKQTKMPIPSTIQEQQAIATALSDIDGLISSLTKLIDKKKNIKHGAMQELLKPKKGWLVKTLGEVADGNKKWSFTGGPFGSNLKSSDYTEDGIRIIQLQNIGDGNFINGYSIFTSITKADELISCNIYPGDIILSKMGDPVARACTIPKYHDRYLMCSDGIRLSVDINEYNPYFICTYINSPVFRVLADNASTGSTRKRIGLQELRNLELMVPVIAEQARIATILSDMDTEIETLQTKLNKYKAIKQGMMQELLTGRIRLVEEVRQ